MSTGIQWTDETWNPTVGCDRISPGCARCYAKSLHDKRHKAALSGKRMAPQYSQPFEVLQMIEGRLDAPLHWRKPRRVFVNSVSDLFHESVPDAFIDRVFAVMALAPQHTFQILTKRAERMRHYFEMDWHRRVAALLMDRTDQISRDEQQQRMQGSAFASLTCGHHNDRFLQNVWLGVSVENQHFADERIPLLLQTPAAVRFISAEPLLGPVDLHSPVLEADSDGYLDWVIVGGESGRAARPCDRRWIYSLVDQCRAAAVPVFVKQLGANSIIDGITRTAITNRDARKRLRDSHGGDPSEWSEELRVREFPRTGIGKQ